jgi:hypothetical protein
VPVADFDVEVDTLLFFVVRIGWPPLLWFKYTMSALAPLLYTIYPPTTPDRESLLIRNPRTNIAYPTEEARRTKNDIFAAWRFVRPLVSMAWSVTLFWVSFTI